ncbi:hypothetical protein Hdeb2414_s0007g00241391 [Helianthus debilis subsp. tardiflorus]
MVNRAFQFNLWFELAEKIIGLTVTNANGLASSGFDLKFAYTAGCVVLVSDVDVGTQSHFVVSRWKLHCSW